MNHQPTIPKLELYLAQKYFTFSISHGGLSYYQYEKYEIMSITPNKKKEKSDFCLFLDKIKCVHSHIFKTLNIELN